MKKVSIVFNFEKEELPEYECELERSKFFGSPVFPKSVIEKGFPEGWVFLCKLKMENQHMIKDLFEIIISHQDQLCVQKYYHMGTPKVLFHPEKKN